MQIVHRITFDKCVAIYVSIYAVSGIALCIGPQVGETVESSVRMRGLGKK